jgi:outer membrane cobalamin receptor
VISIALFIALSICPVKVVEDSLDFKSFSTDTLEVDYRFNPILVTATKVAGAQRDLVASVTVIDGQTLTGASMGSILDVVKSQVPGLYVTEWGVMGFGVAGNSAGKISIRGMGGGANTHVLILRNGRPDFMGLMGCTVADEFVLDGVQRIEVLRGPASFLYGTNATGGVINIVSEKMTRNGFKTILSGGYGVFNTQKYQVSHMGKFGRTEYVLSAAIRRTAGHRNDANSEYRGDHFTAHLGHMLGKNTTLELNANLANIDVHDPGTKSNPFSGHWYDLKRYGGDLTLEHRGRWGSSTMKVHGNFGEHTFYDGWKSSDRTLGIMMYQNIRPWSGNTATVGFDYKR